MGLGANGRNLPPHSGGDVAQGIQRVRGLMAWRPLKKVASTPSGQVTLGIQEAKVSTLPGCTDQRISEGMTAESAGGRGVAACPALALETVPRWVKHPGLQGMGNKESTDFTSSMNMQGTVGAAARGWCTGGGHLWLQEEADQGSARKQGHSEQVPPPRPTPLPPTPRDVLKAQTQLAALLDPGALIALTTSFILTLV